MISRGIGKSAARSVARSMSQFGSGGVAPSYDTDAQTYITAVETADGQSLETGVKDAINAFVVGCKADGIWTAIKASCILAGARTLTGALVPLVGTAPTNNNFVSGDYSRTAGLKGDGSTKYLDSNRANNADPQNNSHVSVLSSVAPSAGGYYVGSNAQVTGNNVITADISNSREGFTSRSAAFQYISGTHAATGFKGTSRAISTSFIARTDQTNTTITNSSLTAEAAFVYIFARNSNTSVAAGFSDATLAFYSIGESLDLALLDSRVTTLITDIGTALV